MNDGNRMATRNYNSLFSNLVLNRLFDFVKSWMSIWPFLDHWSHSFEGENIFQSAMNLLRIEDVSTISVTQSVRRRRRNRKLSKAISLIILFVMEHLLPHNKENSNWVRCYSTINQSNWVTMLLNNKFRIFSAWLQTCKQLRRLQFQPDFCNRICRLQ